MSTQRTGLRAHPAMLNGQDVYAGYGGFSHFANMGSIMARFPNRRYLVFDTHVSQVDAYDVEPGGGSASQAPAFFRQWKTVNINKPGFYADRSDMPSVECSHQRRHRAQQVLPDRRAVGRQPQHSLRLRRQAVRLDQRLRQRQPPVLHVGVQLTPPVPVFPLQVGSTDTADVTTLQENLVKWKFTTVPAKTFVDGSYGPATAAAVTKAQVHFGQRGIPAGECTQSVFNALKAAPGTPPPVLVGPVCAPVSSLALVGEGPHSFRIDFKYVPGVTPAEKFEVAVCQGSHLGPVIRQLPALRQLHRQSATTTSRTAAWTLTLTLTSWQSGLSPRTVTTPRPGARSSSRRSDTPRAAGVPGYRRTLHVPYVPRRQVPAVADVPYP